MYVFIIRNIILGHPESEKKLEPTAFQRPSPALFGNSVAPADCIYHYIMQPLTYYIVYNRPHNLHKLGLLAQLAYLEFEPHIIDNSL